MPAVRIAAFAAMVAGTVIFGVGVLLRRGDSGQILWIDIGVYAVVYLGATVLLLTAPTPEPPLRRAWRWLGLAMLASAAGNVLFSLVTQQSAQPAGPSVADLFYLAWYPLSYLGVVQLLRATTRRPTVAEALDGLIIAGGGAALAVASVLGGLLTFDGAPSVQVLVDLAYPSGDLLLLLLIMTSGIVMGRTATRSGAALAGGLVVSACADLIYLVQDASGTYVEGGWTDLLWLVGVGAIGAAACLRDARPLVSQPASAPIATVVPPVGFAALAVVLIGLEQAGWVAGQVAVPADLAVMAAVLRAGLTVRELRRTKAHEVAELDRLAHTDDLTGLPNRLALLERCLRVLEAEAEPVCLLMLDVDRFKDINDALSHPIGDRLLRQLAERIRTVLGPDDYLGRLGGDEFGVLVLGDEHLGRQRAEAIQDALAEPFVLGGMRLHVTLSIGLASTTSPMTLPADLFRSADGAMYRAKQGHTGIWVHERADGETYDRLRLTEQLRGALRGEDPAANGRVLIHVQPQVALSRIPPRIGTQRLTVGVEALVRWEHPTQGLLLPGSFLPFVDRVGLLSPLADAVLDLTLHACRGWWSAGYQLPLSVNVSANDVLDPALVERVAEDLERHALPPQALVLELTEDTLLIDPAAARSVLGSLRKLGVTLSIDDYGSGYSSLSYLRQLPVDELKLDRAFVADLAANASPTSRSAAIIRTTADLAHSLGLRLVAEGIEDETTFRLLGQLGCDVGQGYHIARPMPADQFVAWLSARTSPPVPGQPTAEVVERLA